MNQFQYSQAYIIFADYHKVTQTQFYKLVKLDTSSSGQAYLDAIRRDMETDSIWRLVTRNLVAVVTDAAANMVGEDKGFVTLLERAVAKPIIKVKCQAHRIETILKHAFKKFANGRKITSFLTNAHSFYSTSPKRKDDLRNYIRKHGADSFVPRMIQDTRWVASHYLAAKVIYLNYDTLLGHLKSLLTSPHFQKDKATLQRARYLISIMEQKHFLSSLALLLDVQHVFKGLSEIYQTKGRSIIGQLNKKTDVIKDVDTIQTQKGGEYITEVLTTTTCTVGRTTDFCKSLSNYENQVVKKGATSLSDGEAYKVPLDPTDLEKTLKVVFPKEKALEVNVEVAAIVESTYDKYQPLSSFMDAYLNAVKSQIRQYFPHTELLKVMVALDQTLFPLNVERVLSNKEVRELWKKWPTLFHGFTEEAKTIDSDMEKVIHWLRDHPDFWCANHQSQPDEFWSLVLREFKLMPVNLVRVLKATLSIPVAGADVERSFSVLTFQKTALRNQMSPELLDILMRIQMSKDTWDTFDANRATEHWTSNNHLVCDHKQNPTPPRPSSGTRPSQRPGPTPGQKSEMCKRRKEAAAAAAAAAAGQGTAERPSSEDESEMCNSMRDDVTRIRKEHDYMICNPSVPRFQLVDKKPRSDCFWIFNKKNGKALTAYGNEVGLWTWNSDDMDSQLWFWHGEYIVSRSTQMVLEADPNSEQRVSLNYYHPNVARQKWSKTAWIQTLDFEFISNYHNLRLDVLENLTENGATVGTAKPMTNSVTQRWKIEEYQDYENV